MTQVGSKKLSSWKKALLWQISKRGPQRVSDGKLNLEEHLEDWIVADPDLLQVGLTVIARQLVVEAGRIDLLALDPAGRWVVAEIKRGTLYRDTVAQGLDYAECINVLPANELVDRCDHYLKGAGKSLRGLLEERDALSQLEHGRREVLLYVVGTGKIPTVWNALLSSCKRAFLSIWSSSTSTLWLTANRFCFANYPKPTAMCLSSNRQRWILHWKH